MSRLIKVILFIVSTVLLLMLAAIVFIVFLVDPNDYKASLSQHVTTKIGREFAIRGDISWTFFPWLGMQAHDISINNAIGFGSYPFASIKAMNIKVKLLPLLHKQVEIGKIALQGAELNLQKNKQGKNNWQDLLEHLQRNSSQDKQELQAVNKPVKKDIDISISEIDVKEANVNWFNQQDNQQLVISKLALQSSNIDNNQPFDIHLSAAFASTQPAVNGNITLKGSLQTNSEQQIYMLKNLELNGLLSDKAFQGNELNFGLKADIDADAKADALSVSNLTASIANMQLTGDLRGKVTNSSQIVTGKVSIPRFNARQFLQAIGKPIPAMQDSQALQKVGAQFAFKLNDRIEFSNLQLNVDESNVLGDVVVHDLKTKRTTLQLSIDRLNLANYLTPTAEVKPIKLSGFEYRGSFSLPEGEKQTLIKQLVTSGTVRMGELQFDKTQISNLSAALNAHQGIIQLLPVHAQLYQGKYLGRLTVNLQASTPVIHAEQTFSGINIASLLHDFKPLTKVQATGVAEVTTQISATGDSWEQARRTLTGKARFVVSKGVLKGINLEHWLNVGSALYHHEPVPSSKVVNETQFGQLTASFNIAHGIARNNDFLLQASFMRVTGQGMVDLINERLNYLFNAVKINPANNQPRKDIIPIRVSGPFANISVKPDIEQLLRNQVKKELANQADKLKEKVGEQLDKTLGKELGDKVRKLNLDKFFR